MMIREPVKEEKKPEVEIKRDTTIDYQKAFVLACRFISDEFVCPAEAVGARFPECNGEMEACGDAGMWECWQRYFVGIVKAERVCRVCGCTQNNACPGGCSWVENDLCSECASPVDKTEEGGSC